MSSSPSTVFDDAASLPGSGGHQQNQQSTEIETKHVGVEDLSGGLAAWCTVFGATCKDHTTTFWLAHANDISYTSAFGVYQDFYTQQYLTNETPSAISWIGSINAFLVTALGLVAGILFDRGHFYHLLIGGALLQSFSLFMLSLAQPGHYYQFLLAQGFGSGIAEGLMYVPSVAVVSHHFRRRRTLAMTLVASGSPLGSMIHPIMLNYLFHNRVGFANGVRISAALVSILLFIACLLMRTRLEPPKNPTNYLTVAKHAIRDAPYMIMTLACVGLMIVFQCGFYFPLFFFQLDSATHGNSQSFSFYSLVFLNGSSFVGRLSAGFIAPLLGVANLTTASTFACGVLILGMIGLSSVTSVIVLGVIYGYFAGVYIALMAPLIAVLTTNHAELGARMGISMAIGGSPVAGALLTSQYRWWIPALFCGVSLRSRITCLLCTDRRLQLAALCGCSLMVVMQVFIVRRGRA
ncbi:major facilitator superfamily domain-containing protein [Phlebopus sp. FC_14]|nr:major facilitator superfamily domain-containing protein [Phlebopus sp. FC_14]